MESTVAKPDFSCSIFGRLGGLDPDAINRFVVGEDAEPRAMSAAEAADELGDPFATLLLLKGDRQPSSGGCASSPSTAPSASARPGCSPATRATPSRTRRRAKARSRAIPAAPC